MNSHQASADVSDTLSREHIPVTDVAGRLRRRHGGATRRRVDLDSVATWAQVVGLPRRGRSSTAAERDFLATRRRLRKCFSRFVRRARAGTLSHLTLETRRRLVHRMGRLSRRLDRLASRLGWSLATGVLAMSVAAGPTHAVTFEERVGVDNPLDAVAVTGSSYPAFVDIDDDGDFDLFVGEYGSGAIDGTVRFYENTGSATNPVFQEQTGAANPLGDLIGLHDLHIYGRGGPSFVDIDNDGDFDAFVGATYYEYVELGEYEGGVYTDDAFGSVLYYENTGTRSSPTFTRRSALHGPVNPLGFVDAGSYYTTLPTFADVDGDGDLDAFVGAYEEYYFGDLFYYENTGSSSIPSFVARTGAANPLSAAYSYTGPAAASFADIDGDGDLDAFVAGYDYGSYTYEAVHYFENTGGPTNPVFERQAVASNPLASVPYYAVVAPSLVDLDGDGDSDAVLGNRYGGLYYYENTTPSSEPLALDVVIQADADGDGVADTTMAPYGVSEHREPASVISVDVWGGVGPTYTVNVVSTPSLGALVDPATGVELSAGDTLSVSQGASLEVQFAGTPQSSAGFEPSDAFVIDVTDDSDPTASTGSIVVELDIADVNQSVVVDREGSAFVASGSVVNVPLVDLTDVDADGVPDPSIYDTDGDSLLFSDAVSEQGATVSIVGSSLQYTASAYTDVAFGDGLTDVVTFTVADSSDLGGDPVTATTLVNIHPVAEVALRIEAGDGSFSRELAFGVGPEGSIDISPTATGTIWDLTAEAAPPEAPGTSARAWISGDGAYARLIEPIASAASTYTWPVHTRTGASGSGSTIAWYAPDVVALLEQFEARTGVSHSAAITDSATGETWDMSGASWSTIQLADSTSYNFDVTVSPAAGETLVSGSLSPGWNLVSVPGFGDLSPLDAYTNSAFVWEGGYRGVGFLTQDDIPAVGGGVFINSNGGTYELSLDVDSSDARDVAVVLDAGWNLIGAPASVGSVNNYPATNITGLFGNQAAVFGYDADAGSYSIASELVPGAGYWAYNDTGEPVEARLTQPRHLDADGASLYHPAQARGRAPSLASPDWALPLSLELADGARRAVEIGLSPHTSAGYDRLDIATPPQPPTPDYSHLYVLVDDPVGRLSRSVQSMDRRGVEWAVRARVGGAHGMLRWERPNVPDHWRLSMAAGDAVIDMAERQSVRLDAGSHDLTIAMAWTAPTATRLMPNYPNPFNPETWIPFELTDAADVTVRIYGQDGSVVRALDLGHRAEGYYTSSGSAAYWDGRNDHGEHVASGVYLYELQAGAYRALRRMVVVK